MKKIILSTLLSLTGIWANAQFSVTVDGSPVTNNAVITVNTVEYPANDKSFHINNTTPSVISLRLKVVSFTNTDGSNMQVCLNGNCYMGVTPNQLFPPVSPLTIAASGNSSIELANFDAGNGTSSIDYNFRLYQIDGNGDETGSPINFTYRYTPNLANATFTLANLGVQIPTLFANELPLITTQDVVLNLMDTTGKVVMQRNLSTGNHSLDTSALQSGMYIAQVTAQGKIATAKLIKR